MRLKVCTCCKKEKPISDFRERQKDGYKYLNPSCRKCDSEKSREYHQKHKDNPEYKKLNRNRAKKYNEENSDQIKAKNKIKRQTKKHKEMRKKYWRNSPEQRQKHKKRLGKYVETLADNYVTVRASAKYNMTAAEVKNIPGLVEVSRALIKTKRAINERIKSERNP